MRTMDHPSQVSEELYLLCMRPPGEPLRITQGTAGWAAAQWTFDFFASRYGDEKLTVADCLLRPTYRLDVPLREYL
ncbi:MAG TPA: hypothetical protein VGO93_00165, partial [Candidatus Xenobia bacterium]